MPLVVQKFGGSSVADVEKIKNVARKGIREKKEGNDVIVVVSAMGKTTDQLIAMAHRITNDPNPREMDMLMSTGEQVSIAMLAIAFHSMGEKAISFTGPQVGIITDSTHRKARIKSINTEKIHKALREGNIVIVAGFQGISTENDITTLGRGGSDTTAVALAAALNADVCDIYTDVDGVYTTDPRIVPKARKLEKITYDEMLELASLGAKVLHSRSVELAKNYNVVIQVRSSFDDNPGTLVVKEDKSMEDIVVSGVAYNRNETKISIIGVPDHPGVASEIFSKIADAHIVVDMIIQNVGGDGKNDISFTVGKEDFVQTLKISKQLCEELGANEVRSDDKIAKVSVVGVGMKTHCGVAAKMFRALANAGINIDMISTSEIKISCVIRSDDLDKAVQAIHDELELEAHPS
ncbi:aspartate kinase [Candidatus Sumerlaeota bacterium]|nr:aspartate kinase [Candidatus Sumerlaeota bacterium]